jgi:hypothetical protein
MKFQKNPLWDQSEFDLFESGFTNQRRSSDQAFLERAFNYAAERSPETKAALAWAYAHGVRFFVDHDMIFDGYYTPGTGVVGMSADLPVKSGTFAKILTHELRHAEQDEKGFFSESRGLMEEVVKECVVEADASATGKLAGAQVQYTQFSRPITISPREGREMKWTEFKNWYAEDVSFPAAYAKKLIEFTAQEYGLFNDIIENDLKEFSPENVKPMQKRQVDVLCCDQVFRQLNSSFVGNGYFDQKEGGGFVKKVLDPQYVLSHIALNPGTLTLAEKVLAHEKSLAAPVTDKKPRIPF